MPLEALARTIDDRAIADLRSHCAFTPKRPSVPTTYHLIPARACSKRVTGLSRRGWGTPQYPYRQNPAAEPRRCCVLWLQSQSVNAFFTREDTRVTKVQCAQKIIAPRLPKFSSYAQRSITMIF